MSALAEAVTVLAPSTGRGARSRSRRVPASRPVVQLAAFCALGLYGALRWSTLLHPRPTGRLLALLALAALAIGGLGALTRRGAIGRAIAILGAAAIVISALALSGVPTSLIVHARIHTIVTGIGQGLAALPRVTVPYAGIDTWARIVILLGAAVLLLDAGLLLAFAPAGLGDARRAAAALPLIALAVVPSTLMRPSHAYLHGLLLLGLLAALVWGERLQRRGLAAAVLAIGAAGAVALAAAPALDNHRPWVNYESLAGAFSPEHVETFDWTQHYGPLIWPQSGREMLDVQAQHGDYWKAEDLDTFNGVAWVPGAADSANVVPAPDPSAISRWTQTLRVTLRGMTSADVIAAGYASSAPDDLPVGSTQGISPGTWTALATLGPGDSYQVTTYSPRPSDAQLNVLGEQDPTNLLSGYRSILLPATAASPYTQPELVFPTFHSREPVASYIGQGEISGSALVYSSAYRRAYELARQLETRARTPFAFVQSVERYLAHGFTYSQDPPVSAYPLVSFLFQDKLGYCQQFSGAMALLLRMGGVPARVAAGFTSGTYDPIAHHWVVSDRDAHAWVEVWFPHYGWVRFDPTPAAAPARGGRVGAPPTLARGAAAAASRGERRPEPEAPASSSPRHAARSGSVTLDVALAMLIAVLALGAFAARRAARRPAEPVRELERALARCGRPIAPGTTLAQLEHRFRSSPDAAGYVHALLLARYATRAGAPPPGGRRALRAHLAAGLGPTGRLRAIWALPPRIHGTG